MTVAYFLDTIHSDDIKYPTWTKPGMSRTDISAIEQQLSVKLPDDLVDFYSFTNGVEGDDWIFNIIPLNEVEKLVDETGDYLVFAEYMIYSETCGLEIENTDRNKYKFFTWTKDVNDLKVFKRKYIADSIIDFIKLYCDKGTFGIFTD